MSTKPVTVKKLLNFLLLVFSLIPYWEWGNNNRGFIFEAEQEVLKKLFTNPLAAAHPLTLVPLAAQLLLLFSLFQKAPRMWITFISVAGLSILLLLILFIGVLSRHWVTVFSVLPFVITAAAAIWYYRRHHIKPLTR